MKVLLAITQIRFAFLSSLDLLKAISLCSQMSVNYVVITNSTRYGLNKYKTQLFVPYTSGVGFRLLVCVLVGQIPVDLCQSGSYTV